MLADVVEQRGVLEQLAIVLTEVVERTLRAGLTAAPARRTRVTLPSYDLGPFLVDPRDRGAIASALKRPERG